MKKQNNLSMKKGHIFLLFLSVISILWISFAYFNGKKIRESHTLTVGEITRIYKSGGRGRIGPKVEFEYVRNNKLVSSVSFNKEDLLYSIDNFVGKSFPVIYAWNGLFYDDKILITPDDFESYDYIFPDSLNWVKVYIAE
jgi:hypothetical protein